MAKLVEVYESENVPEPKVIYKASLPIGFPQQPPVAAHCSTCQIGLNLPPIRS